MAPPVEFEPTAAGLEGSLTKLRVRGATVNLHEDLVRAEPKPVLWIR